MMERYLHARPRFAPALLLACMTLLCGCRSGQAKRTVAVITKSTGTDQWRELRDGIQASPASRGWTLQWTAPESEADYTQQADMLEKAIDRHVDGILLTPTHQMVLASAVRRAHDAGIPVVIVDAPIALPSDQYAGYVGSNDVEIGLLAAERAAVILHDKGCVGVIGVSPTLESSSLRERTFRERLKQQSPQVRVCAAAYGLSDWGRSAEAVRDMLNQHPEIDLLFTSDAFETLGTMSEVRQHRHRPVLIGVDNEYSRRTAVDRGEIDSLVLEDMRAIGTTAAQMLNDAMNGSHAHRTEEVPVSLRTALPSKDVSADSAQSGASRR